jgi:hypothetical protein
VVLRYTEAAGEPPTQSMSHCDDGDWKEVQVNRRAILLMMASMVAGAVIWAPDLAAANGDVQVRGYAVIRGPGLAHPIVYSAPWDSVRGGYYSDEAEIFLALANLTGAIPAGRDLLAGGGSVPDGVLPIASAPIKRSALGPRYRLIWFRDGVPDVAKQDLYPYVAGGPLVYTLPASRQSLVDLFGRFQDPAHLWTGWGRATSGNLLNLLRFKGMPGTAPTDGTVGDMGPPGVVTAAGDAVETPRSASDSAGPLLAVVLALGAVLATGAIWLRRRLRTSHAAARSGPV